jgi:chorismate mutase
MNYLTSYFFGSPEKPAEWETFFENKTLFKYYLYYSPYSLNWKQPIINGEQQWNNYMYEKAIQENKTYSMSSFPDVDRTIYDTEDYETIVNKLSELYTKKALDNKNVIEITRRITPASYMFEDKEYDFSIYEFIITINKY